MCSRVGYLDTILGVVGALGEERGGEDGVGAEEGLADVGDGDHGGLLEDGGHDVFECVNGCRKEEEE